MSSDLTRLRVYERRNHQPHYAKCFRAAVSMHCHTSHSRESLTFIPHYARRIPVISRFFESEMKRYGETIDFARAWWTPPATARQVFEMETVEVEIRLGLPAIVSITDHDDITAGLWLQSLDSQGRIPISVEWTVPYGRGYFHLGVHNLPPDRASELMREMSAYSQIDGQPRQRMDLRDLLAWITEFPETLVALNHPLWDIEFIGGQHHAVALGSFLGEHKDWIHALEINGFRPWRENKAVMTMAQDFGLPAVTERTRQIGILKALGASKRFIAIVFIKESMLVSAMGVAGGLLIALLARPALAAWAGLKIEIEIGYTLCAALGGLASGLMGAIYPALRAAGQDAVEALNYE